MEVLKYSASIRRISPFGIEPLRQAVPFDVLRPSARSTFDMSVLFFAHSESSRSRNISNHLLTISEIGNIISLSNYKEEQTLGKTSAILAASIVSVVLANISFHVVPERITLLILQELLFISVFLVLKKGD